MPLDSSYPHRRHPRLAGFDYSTPGYYFVTLCVQDRLPLFGTVEHGVMRRSPAGEMVEQAWRDLAALHPGIATDTLMAMPDHVHAIVVLGDDQRRTLPLPDVMQRYKALTTKRYTHGVRDKNWHRFAGKLWQASYYDHVIRKDEDLDAIRRYIVENAVRWQMRREAADPDS